jgi:polyisoprenoid-binding protein YceI
MVPKGNGDYKMAGSLTIRGNTKPVVFELPPPAGPIATRGSTKIGASASGKINRKDFGVRYHEVMDNGGLGVADEVFIQLDVELIQRAPRTFSN